MFLGRVLVFLFLMMAMALGQTPGTFVPGQVLTAAEINTALGLKSNYPYIGPVGTSGVTISGTPSVGWVPVATGANSAVWGSLPGSTVIDPTGAPYNAKCDGTTDDTTAIQAALNTAGALPQGWTVVIPSAVCYTVSGITIPTNVRLQGNGFFPSNPQFGSQIKCALTTPVCVQVGTTSSNGSVQVSDLGVTRAAGTPSSSTIGVLVKDAYNVTLTNVSSINHGICFEAQADTVYGIALHAIGIHSGACVDAHFVDNSWPEIQIINSEFGMAGLGNYNANAYVRFTGGSVGPNTFYAANNQFNQGNGTVGTAIDFKSLTTPTDPITSEFSFIGNHFENHNYVVQTDSSATQINRLRIIGNSLLNSAGSGEEFWNFGAATTIYDLNITGNTIFQNSFTFNPGGQISTAVITGNQFAFSGVSTTYNGTGAGNVMSATGNIYNGSVVLSGSWSTAEFGGALISGSLTNTTTGAVGVNFPGEAGLASCASTLGVSFGGASTGVTYGTQACTYQVIGDLVTVQYTLVLTSKGSATGAATLVGLPFTSSATAGIEGGAVVPYALNFSSLAGPGISISPAANTTTANLYTGTSTGVTSLLDTNFSNTSTIAGTFQYRMSP